MNQTVSVAICVATYLRPKSLGQLIDSLRVLEIDGIDVQLIIADNDPEGSAQAVFVDRTRDFPYPVTYVVEPTRGLAAIRNRLFAEAYARDVEFIASVDDDATVDRRWLQELVNTAITYNADAVGGVPIFWVDDDIPTHVKQLFRPAVRPTGEPTRQIGTGNALYRVSAVKELDGPFDLRFSLSAGEDILLDAMLHRRGHKIVGCAEALVYEYVPRSRANAVFLIKKGYSGGVLRGRIVLIMSPTPSSIIGHIVNSLGRIIVGTFQVLWHALVNRKLVLRYSVRIASGVGGIVIILFPKAMLQQYKTIHGG